MNYVKIFEKSIFQAEKLIEKSRKTEQESIEKLVCNLYNYYDNRSDAELIQMYWSVGEYLSKLCTGAVFGDKIIDDVAAYIAKENPGAKGFNRRGLYRMKQFYETYKDDEFVTPPVTQISWTND